MRILFIIFLSLFQLNVFSQLNWDKTSYQFGSIEKDSKRWVDFQLTNNTSKHIYLMRAIKDDDIDLIYTRGKIEKDSSAFVRVQINPSTIGPFRKTIQIYVSSEQKPIELKISGSINYIDPNNDPACPSFSSQKPGVSSELITVVEILDAKTNRPIKNADINVANPQLINHTDITNREGKYSFKTITGFHSVYANAEGYQPKEISQPITYNNNFITIYLDKEEEVGPTLADDSNIDEQIDEYIEEALAEQQKPVPPIVEERMPESIPPTETYIPQSPNELSADIYAPNNVVFLMDVSNSMGKYDKLELLKVAVKEMVGVLRSFDRISIITYSSTVNVILPSTSGAEKDKIYAIVDSLQAGGLTAGQSGIKTAYEIAFDNFIENANNQVIITTDGAFNIEEEGYNTKQEALKNALKGVHLSVLGVRTAQIYAEGLEDLSKWGRGHYLYIKNEADAKESLVEELKANSKMK